MSVKTDRRNIRFNGWRVNPSPPEEAEGQAHGARSPGRLRGPEATRVPMDPRDHIPDVRDGLTRAERILLHTLHRLQRERGDRSVPSALLYGNVVEHLDIGPDEFQELLTRLVGRRVK